MFSSVTEAAPSRPGEEAEPNTFESLLDQLGLSPKLSTPNNFFRIFVFTIYLFETNRGPSIADS